MRRVNAIAEAAAVVVAAIFALPFAFGAGSFLSADACEHSMSLEELLTDGVDALGEQGPEGLGGVGPQEATGHADNGDGPVGG